VLRRVNLNSVEAEYDDADPDGYHAGMARFGKQLGAVMLGGSVYELPPGQSNCPYHYEYGNEEWLIVLSGRVSVRHPGGEEELEPGDTVCFGAGPDGAHKLTNKGAEVARVLMFSTMVEPAVAVYPDSDKIGVWPDPDRRDHILVRRESSVDYWDREL
jgi:uncharacterized cupin superfamily protein